MPALRETIRPILFIVVAASIVVLLIAPLDQTQWAAGMRAGAASDVGEGVKGSDPSGAIRFIGPLLKIAILMGVPALVTLGIRRLIRRFFEEQLSSNGILTQQNKMRAVALTRYLPIDDPKSLLDVELDKPKPTGSDQLVAYPRRPRTNL